MYISADLGKKTYGGYYWKRYWIKMYGFLGTGRDRTVEVHFFNEEKGDVYGKTYTSNKHAMLNLDEYAVKALYTLLRDVLTN